MKPNGKKKATSTIRATQVDPGSQLVRRPRVSSPYERAIKCLAKAKENVQLFLKAVDQEETSQEKQQLLEATTSISHLLGELGENSENETESLRSIEGLGELYVFRDSRRVVILGPVDILKCNSTYNQRKNVSFFRKSGAYFPEKYALSGWKPCVESHSKVLDSAKMLEQIKMLAKNHELHFRTNGWDVWHGMDIGDGFACHAEVQTMLACCLKLLGDFTGKEPTVGKLYKLQAMKTAKSFDIGISDQPCTSCLGFATMLQLQTGVTFNFVILKKLLVTGQKTRKSDEYQLLDKDFRIPRTELQVVIRSKAVQHLLATPPKTPVHKVTEARSDGIQQTRNITTKTATTTTHRSTTITSTSRKRSRKDYWSEADEDDDELFGTRQYNAVVRRHKSPRNTTVS